MAKSFQEYLAEAQAKQGTSNRFTPIKTSGTIAPTKSTGGGDPISTLIDFLSRPLYAVTNVPNQILNETQKAYEAQQAGTPYDAVGGAVNVLTSPFRGLLSTNPEDKITTAQLIEKNADVQGMKQPGYVNVENNVDPAIAGMAGFAGDVVLDPTTYLGGVIAKGVTKGLGLASSALRGAAKTGEEASLAAAAALRTTGKNVAEEAAKANEVSDYLTQKYNIQDTKPIVEDVPSVIPKGETDAASVAEEIAKTAEESTRQAAAAANAAKAGEKAVDTTEVMPTLSSLIKDLPTTYSGGRSVSQNMGHWLQKIRSGEIDVTATKKPMSPESYLDRIRNEIAYKRSRGVEIPKAQVDAVARMSVDKNYLREQHAMYLKKYFPDYAKETAKPVQTAREFMNSVKSRGDFMPYPKGYRKPAGATGMKPKDVREALGKGTLHGKQLTREQIAAIESNVTAKMGEAAPAAKAVEAPTTAEFANRIRSFITTEEGAANTIFGSKLASKMRAMGDERLAYTADLLEGLANGSRSLDNVTEYLITNARQEMDSYSSTVKAFGEMVSSATGLKEFENIPAYNLLRRQAISNVNSDLGARMATGLAEGRTVEEMLVQSGVTSEEALSVSKWFPKWLEERVAKSKAEYVSDGGTLRTSDILGQGKAYDMRELSTYEMWDLYQRASKSAIEEAAGRGLSRKARADFVRARTMSELAMAEKMLDQFGWPMWIGVHNKGLRYLASPSQVLSAMFKANPKLLNMVMFNGSTVGPYTYMMDVLVESIALGKPVSSARVKELLTGKASKEYYKSIDGTFNAPKTNSFVTGGTYGNEKLTGKQLIDQFDKSIPDMLAALKPVIDENMVSYTTRFKSEAGDLAENVINDMEALAADPARVGKMLDYIVNLEQNVSRQAIATGALDLSALRAIEVTHGIVPDATRVAAKETAKGAAKAKTATRKGNVHFTEATPKPKREKVAKQVDAEAEKAAQPNLAAKLDEVDNEYNAKLADADPTVVGARAEDLTANNTYGRITTKLASLMNSQDNMFAALSSRFSRHYNMEHLSNSVHSIGGTVRQIRHNYTVRLKQLEKANQLYPGTETPLMTKIFQDVQIGQPTKGYEDLYNEVRLLTSEVADVSGEFPLLGDPFFRSQQGIQTIQKFLERAKVNEAYIPDMDLAAKRAAENGTDLWTEYSKLWRELPVDDPIQFLAQRHAALMRMNMHISLAHDFERMAKAEGFYSTTPKPGFVKAEGLEGDFFEFLPDNVYFDAVIMKELQHFSDIAEASRSIGGPLGQFLNKYIMPIQNDWKYAITLPRPGHHIRNAIGDATLTYMAEGARYHMKSSNDAFKILGVKNNYTDVDLFNALRNRGVTEIPKKGEVLTTAKGQDITSEWAYDAMTKQGLLPTYHVGEDYVDDIVQPSAITTVANKLALRGGKIEKTAGAISEARDHWARAQHFMQIIRKHANDPQFKTLDDLVEYAGKRVKKYHPDSSMLTAFEAKYMRTLIPFYSWFRGALPAIVESTMMYPGRFMMFPKASFNLAYSMGINPATLYDPFPDDQLFPSFLTDSALGPQFKIGDNFFGMNPGIAAIDVYNQLGTGEPLRGIAGMTSPLFRVPLELMSGGSWGTGARIKDASDYVDASIPGINYLSNITGISPTGSVASVMQGMGLDPQYQVSAGNKGIQDQGVSLLNWLTGLGFQNMSKPNYINYAEIEKRNAAAKDQRSAY